MVWSDIMTNSYWKLDFQKIVFDCSPGIQRFLPRFTGGLQRRKDFKAGGEEEVQTKLKKRHAWKPRRSETTLFLPLAAAAADSFSTGITEFLLLFAINN
jgi:hypothetical protein